MVDTKGVLHINISQTRFRNNQNRALDLCGPNVHKPHLEEFQFSNWILFCFFFFWKKRASQFLFLGQKLHTAGKKSKYIAGVVGKHCIINNNAKFFIFPCSWNYFYKRYCWKIKSMWQEKQKRFFLSKISCETSPAGVPTSLQTFIQKKSWRGFAVFYNKITKQPNDFFLKKGVPFRITIPATVT